MDEIYSVYTWLINISDKSVFNKTTFDKYCREFKISDNCVKLAKEQFFDKKQLEKGVYTWNSIRPNVKMAQRLIEEVNYNLKNNKSMNKSQKHWTEAEEVELAKLCSSRFSNKEMATKLGRSVLAIEQKKFKLGLNNNAQIRPKITKIEPTIQPKIESIKIEPIQEKKQASDNFGKQDVTLTINFSKIWHKAKLIFYYLINAGGVIALWEFGKYLWNK